MRRSSWSVALLIVAGLTPLACKTTKGKVPTKPSTTQNKPGDKSCVGQMLALAAAPMVDPAELTLRHFVAKGLPIPVKDGVNSVAQFQFEVDTDAPSADVFYVKACDQNGATQDPLQCKGPDFVLRTPGETENRLAAGTYHIAAWPCVWSSRKSQSAAASGFFEVTPSDYPGRSLACSKSDINKTIYLQPAQQNAEVAGLMQTQQKSRIAMHRSVYDMRHKLGEHYNKISLAGAPESAVSFHSQAQNLLNMGEMGNVMVVETDAYDRAVVNSVALLEKKEQEEPGLGLADSANTKGCVTADDWKVDLPFPPDPDLGTTPEPNPGKAPTPTGPVDALAEARDACTKRGTDYFFENARCWHRGADGKVTDVTNQTVNNNIPSQPAPQAAPPADMVSRANTGGGIAMITMGSVLLVGGTFTAVQSGRALYADRVTDMDTLERFFPAGEVSIDPQAKLVSYGKKIDQLSGDGMKFIGKYKTPAASSGAMETGSKRAFLGGALSMVIGAVFIGVGESLRNGSIGLASDADPAIAGTLAIVNPAAASLNALRSDYIARGQRINDLLEE